MATTFEQLAAQNHTVEEAKELFEAAVAEYNADIATKNTALETAKAAFKTAFEAAIKSRNNALKLRNQYRALLPAGSYDPNDRSDYSPLNDIAITAVPDYTAENGYPGALVHIYESYMQPSTLTDSTFDAIYSVLDGVYSSAAEDL